MKLLNFSRIKIYKWVKNLTEKALRQLKELNKRLHIPKQQIFTLLILTVNKNRGNLINKDKSKKICFV